MNISQPFQISEQDWSYSTTLTEKDIGKWALLINGTFQLFSSFADALECKKYLETSQ